MEMIEGLLDIYVPLTVEETKVTSLGLMIAGPFKAIIGLSYKIISTY
jgi:hypothetical protein